MATLSNFREYSKKVRMKSPKIKRGMKFAWPWYENRDLAIMEKLKAINEEKRSGLYGSAYLRSKVINLNPVTLGRDGMMWATSALHEAEHGVNGAGEDGAIKREFSFLGRYYKRAIATGQKGVAQRTLKAAAIAMRQRKRMVSDKARSGDKDLLLRSGFSDKASDFLLGV